MLHLTAIFYTKLFNKNVNVSIKKREKIHSASINPYICQFSTVQILSCTLMCHYTVMFNFLQLGPLQTGSTSWHR